MAAYPQPLDLYTLFVNYFAGSYKLFVIIAMFFFGYYAIKLKMHQLLFIILMGLFIILFVPMWLAILIIIVALMVYSILSKVVKQ
jgi:hypothetical protein